MSIIQGMAYVQLYKNKACTRPLDQDENGDYIFKLNKISSNAINPYALNMYAKNIGSHTAYDFKLSVLDSTLQTTITTPVTSLSSHQIATCAISMTINSLNSYNEVIVRLEYDNV